MQTMFCGERTVSHRASIFARLPCGPVEGRLSTPRGAPYYSFLKSFPLETTFMRFSSALSLLAITLATCAAISQPSSHSAKVAATPPMGWNSWNYFAEKVTDKDIRDSADQIVSSGMKDAGYIYVNIDDTWEGEREPTG